MPKEIKIIFSAIRNRRVLYLGIFAAVLSSALAAFIPYIYGRLVDAAIVSNASTKIIFEFVGLWLLLSFGSDLFNRYSSRRGYEIATDVTNDLLINLFYHLHNLPMSFHKEKRTGSIMRRAQRGVDDLFDLIDTSAFSFVPTVLTFLAAMIILLFVQAGLAFILLFSSGCYILITLSFTKSIIKKQAAMNKGWEKAYGDLFESTSNIQTIKAASSEDLERSRNIKNFNAAGRILKEWRLIWVKMNLWQRAIFTLSFMAVFVFGLLMLKAGKMTPGVFIMFIGYTSLLTSPLAQLASQYRQAKTAINSFRRAIKYFDLAPEKDLAQSKEIKEIKGKIVFKNVSFAYKKGKSVLREISFDVLAGQTIALVGKSGVGKTTITDLVSRYYLPQKGTILIDGQNIKNIKLKSLRRQIAIVPQEVLLFNDTIKNNIRYGNPKATDAEVVAAAKAANAHEFIENFPQKYGQLVGERGIKLSTGQKQRVAIARAILRNPKILILDEATSALDSVSERLVQEAFQKLIKDRTTFIIAHRLSTIMRADKIIVLERGRVAEQGTHGQLMQNPEGIYRNFWELQTAIEKVK